MRGVRGRATARAVGVAVPALLLAAGVLSGRQSAERAAYVVRMGADTFAVERFSRTAAGLEGEVAGALVGRLQYAAVLTADALVSRYELSAWAPGSPAGGRPVQTVSVEFRGDSAIAQVGGGGGAPETQRIGTEPGAVPMHPISFVLIEQVLRRARLLGGERVDVPLFNLAGGRTITATVAWQGVDSAVVSAGGTELRLRVDAAGRLLGGRIPAQNLTIERTAGSGVELESLRPDYSAPAGAPYTAHEVVVPARAGHTLAGTLTLPRSAPGPVPAVVTITGSGGQDRDESVLPGYRPFRQIADTLSRRGIAVLRLDDRGVGGSTGDAATATSADFADDVRAALDYLRGRDEIDRGRLALVGHSEGGLIAPMVAVADPSVRAIVLMAGPSKSGREIIAYQQRYVIENSASLTAAERDSALAAAAGELAALAAEQPWLRFFLDYDPLPTAAAVRRPVLILQGETDRQITAEQAEELAAAIRAAGNDDVEVRVFPGVNHLFLADPDGSPAGYAALPSKRVVPQVLGVLADWLARKLGSAGEGESAGAPARGRPASYPLARAIRSCSSAPARDCGRFGIGIESGRDPRA